MSLGDLDVSGFGDRGVGISADTMLAVTAATSAARGGASGGFLWGLWGRRHIFGVCLENCEGALRQIWGVETTLGGC